MDKLLTGESPKSDDSRVALVVLVLAFLGFLAYFISGSPVDYPQTTSHGHQAQSDF